MFKSIFNYFIIFLFFFILSCEEKKQENASNSDNSEIETKNIPTNEKVEYVFACMQGNENSQAYIAKCSCSIDYIEEQMERQLASSFFKEVMIRKEELKQVAVRCFFQN